MRTRGRWTCGGFATLGAVALGIGIGACTTTNPPAGLELVLTTNLVAPRDYDAIRVQVSQQTSTGSWNQIFDYAFMMPGGATLPATLAIAPGPSQDQDALIQVTAYSGYQSDSNPGTKRVVRDAQLQIPLTRVAELDIELESICINVICTNPDQSCQPDDGMCGSNLVQASSLPTYEQGGVTTTLDAGASCKGATCDAPTSTTHDGSSTSDGGNPHDATMGDTGDDSGSLGDDSGDDSDDVGNDSGSGDGGGDDAGHDDAGDRDGGSEDSGHEDAGDDDGGKDDAGDDAGNESHDAARDAPHDGPKMLESGTAGL
jgi:hypothetical protein